jgi:hypothetical protein
VKEGYEAVLCSDCFNDTGLRLDAERGGNAIPGACGACGSEQGVKLSKGALEELARRFFVRGSLHKSRYGAAPVIEGNYVRSTDVEFPQWLRDDVKKIENAIGVGFFYYGPRHWMIGRISHLQRLIGEDEGESDGVISRILEAYPENIIDESDVFYRLRKGPLEKDDAVSEFDSPPDQFCGGGRLDSPDLPIMYGSQDLQICVHECRVAAEDTLYVATLAPTRKLRLLDLSVVLHEADVTEFESLDLSVNLLFLAAAHSYPVCRKLAKAAHAKGFDGLIYPSYFGALRTGSEPYRTVFGFSRRWLPQTKPDAQLEVIENFAIFGRPIEDGRVSCLCINRLMIERADYSLLFGPVGY